MRNRVGLLIPSWAKRKALRAKLGTVPFGVVSNNCWGAHIYRHSEIEYATPFVGLALAPAHYLTLLSNWELLRSSLEFVESSADPVIERVRQDRKSFWPVGLLGGVVEIQFMHEPDYKTARLKWMRRLQRMPVDRSKIYLKFDDVDGASEEQLVQFLDLDFPHKVFFTANRRRSDKYPATVFIPTRSGKLPDGWTLSKISPSYFDSAAWVAGRRQPTRKWFSLV